MCEFKSWIEKDGKILHLTDLDLRDKVIKERLKDCKDNDILGHGAIRKAYNITGGKDYEVKDFWNTKKLPIEIAKTIKEFNKSFTFSDEMNV